VGLPERGGDLISWGSRLKLKEKEVTTSTWGGKAYGNLENRDPEGGEIENTDDKRMVGALLQNQEMKIIHGSGF